MTIRAMRWVSLSVAGVTLACSTPDSGTVRLPAQTPTVSGDEPPVMVSPESPVEYPAALFAAADRGESDPPHVRGHRGNGGTRFHQDRRVERLSVAGFRRYARRAVVSLRAGAPQWGAGRDAFPAAGTFPPSGSRRADPVTPPHLRAYDSVLDTIGWTPLIRLAPDRQWNPHSHLRQGRVRQSRRVGQGSDRPRDHRGCGAQG